MVTKRNLGAGALGLFFAFGSAYGCSRGDKQPPAYGQTRTTGAPVARAHGDVAASQLAAATCDRAVACGDVGGDDGDYKTREDCVKERTREGKDDLRAAECPGGVDRVQLDKCLTEIRGQRCGDPMDALGKASACRTSALCLD